MSNIDSFNAKFCGNKDFVRNFYLSPVVKKLNYSFFSDRMGWPRAQYLLHCDVRESMLAVKN